MLNIKVFKEIIWTSFNVTYGNDKDTLYKS